MTNQQQNLTFDDMCRGAYVQAKDKMTQKRAGATATVGVVPTVNKQVQHQTAPQTIQQDYVPNLVSNQTINLNINNNFA